MRLREELAREQQHRSKAETKLHELQERLEETEMQGHATRKAELQEHLAEQKDFLEQAWEEKLAVERSYREAAEATAAAAEQRLAAQAGELEASRTRAAAAEATALAKWNKEGEERISEAVSQAILRTEAKSKAQLEEARKGWEEDTRNQISAAREEWRNEESKRLSAARAEWQKELQSQSKQKRGVLRAIGRRQRLGALLRPLKRVLLIGGLAAGGWFAYQKFGAGLDLSGSLEGLGGTLGDWLGDGKAAAGEAWAFAKAQFDLLLAWLLEVTA
jgi:hypothetical protein